MSDTPAPPQPPLSTTLSRHERRLVFALAGIQFSHILDFMIMMPLGPMLMQALAINTGEFALLVSIYTLTAALSGLVSAAFIDHFERKGLLLTLFALFIAATLSCGLAPDYASLLFTRGWAGVFGGVLSAMLHTIVGDAIPFERRGQASGMVMSATSAATVLGVPASLLLVSSGSWRWPFFVIGAVALLFWVQAARTLPRLPRAAAASAPQARPLASVRAVLRDRNHLVALLFMTLGAFSTFTVIPYLTLYLTSNVGVTVQHMPLVYVLGGLAGFATARAIGRLADRWGKVRAYRWIALLSIVPIFVQTHMPALALGWVLLGSTLFFTFGPGRSIPAMAITVSAVQPALRGTFMSLNAAIQQLACGAAALVGGLLISQTPQGVVQGYDHAGWLAIALTGATWWLAGRIRLHTGPARR